MTAKQIKIHRTLGRREPLEFVGDIRESPGIGFAGQFRRSRSDLSKRLKWVHRVAGRVEDKSLQVASRRQWHL
jgi:hypothetical protein